MERMEKEGVVGAANHAGKREILIETAGRRPRGRRLSPRNRNRPLRSSVVDLPQRVRRCSMMSSRTLRPMLRRPLTRLDPLVSVAVIDARRACLCPQRREPGSIGCSAESGAAQPPAETAAPTPRRCRRPRSCRRSGQPRFRWPPKPLRPDRRPRRRSASAAPGQPVAAPPRPSPAAAHEPLTERQIVERPTPISTACRRSSAISCRSAATGAASPASSTSSARARSASNTTRPRPSRSSPTAPRWRCATASSRPRTSTRSRRRR